MLLFDGQVQRDTHVIPMGNYVIVFGASAGLHWFQTWAHTPVRAARVPVLQYPDHVDYGQTFCLPSASVLANGR